MSLAVTIKPIWNRADSDAALARLDEIFEPEPGTPEEDEDEVLTVLIQAYEKQHYPVGESDPVEASRFPMDRLSLKKADLIPFRGGKLTSVGVLKRKRTPTVERIRNLRKGLGIPLESLAGEPKESLAYAT